MRFVPTQGIAMVHTDTAPSLDPVWDAVEAHLEAAKRAVTDEIRNYPQPIAGCDAQIPALWERRDRLIAELERLAAARRLATGDAGQAIDAFVSTSPHIDGKTAGALRDLLDQGTQDVARTAAE